MTAPGVVVLDYGSGNLSSVVRAVERAGATVTLTGDFVTALGAIHFMLAFVRRYSLWPFVWYRIALACVVVFFVRVS